MGLKNKSDAKYQPLVYSVFYEGFTDYPDTHLKLVTRKHLCFSWSTEKANPLKETLLLYC